MLYIQAGSTGTRRTRSSLRCRSVSSDRMSRSTAGLGSFFDLACTIAALRVSATNCGSSSHSGSNALSCLGCGSAGYLSRQRPVAMLNGYSADYVRPKRSGVQGGVGRRKLTHIGRLLPTCGLSCAISVDVSSSSGCGANPLAIDTAFFCVAVASLMSGRFVCLSPRLEQMAGALPCTNICGPPAPRCNDFHCVDQLIRRTTARVWALAPMPRPSSSSSPSSSAHGRLPRYRPVATNRRPAFTL